MAQRGRPPARVVLSEDERETLERWARRPKSAQALALRCRIVLAAEVDLLLVIGSRNSSNSNRLVETGRAAGSLRVFLCIGGWLGVVGDAVSEVDA